jgi:hypothetical protein
VRPRPSFFGIILSAAAQPNLVSIKKWFFLKPWRSEFFTFFFGEFAVCVGTEPANFVIEAAQFDRKGRCALRHVDVRIIYGARPVRAEVDIFRQDLNKDSASHELEIVLARKKKLVEVADNFVDDWKRFTAKKTKSLHGRCTLPPSKRHCKMSKLAFYGNGSQ